MRIEPPPSITKGMRQSWTRREGVSCSANAAAEGEGGRGRCRVAIRLRMSSSLWLMGGGVLCGDVRGGGKDEAIGRFQNFKSGGWLEDEVSQRADGR